MKKLILLPFMALFLLNNTNAQTTQAEWNYAIRGWKNAKSNGLPILQGYKIEQIQPVFQDIQIYVMTREENNSIVCYILTVYSSWRGTEYKVIPHPESEQQVMQWYARQDISEQQQRRIIQIIPYITAWN